MNVEIVTEATQFLSWGYINGIFVAVQYIRTVWNKVHIVEISWTYSAPDRVMNYKLTWSTITAKQKLKIVKLHCN
jgi:hypothetical protein